MFYVNFASFQDRTGFEPVFKNAHYWSTEQHWKWATEPNQREKASFLTENILPIQESGQLKFTTEGEEPIPGMEIFNVNGHTEAMMIPHIKYGDKTLVFMADLLPSAAHVPIPYVMAYDVRLLITLKEKNIFENLIFWDGKLFDPNYFSFIFKQKKVHLITFKFQKKRIHK